MRSRCRLLIVAAALLMVTVAPPAARAAYTGPQLLSGTALQQFSQATLPALAGDGEWVAFQGTVGGVSGVYRRNLATGETDLVVGGAAESPSISADGSVVAFTSAEDLDPADEPSSDRGCAEVYVRNMNVVPATYALVAAFSGATTGIQFTGCSGTGATVPVTGAQAASGVALSDDGNEVAFTVDSPSNLGQSPGAPATVPASQVAVRDISAETTTLVSVTPQGQPTPLGGAFPSTTSLQVTSTAASESNGFRGAGSAAASTAAISGDGTTVAWMGTDVPAQVPGATDVTAGMAGLTGGVEPSNPAGLEVEPLWRRIADGPAAQTVRLMAGAGLDFYRYQKYFAGGEQPPPIEGGTWEASAPGAPSLSDDGETVALLADAPPPASLPAILVDPTFTATLPADAFVVRVSDGSAPAVTPLTDVQDYVAAASATSPVTAIAVSPDGSEVGLETARTQFSLAAPALITPPTEYDNVIDSYAVDLPAGTMQLLTTTYDGSPPDGDSGPLSFDDADDLAAASEAANLFYGNVNPTAPQVYLYGYVPTTSAVAAGSISALPGSATTTPDVVWTLSATAAAQRNGTVVVRATVPGAGTVNATARTQLARRSAAPGRARGRTSAPVASRTVATARHAVATATVARIVLHLRPSFRRLAAARGELYCTVTVDFTAPGHSALLRRVPVRFRLPRRPGRRPTRSTRPRTGPGEPASHHPASAR